MSPSKGPSQSYISASPSKEGGKSEVERIREFKARMADMKNLKPRLTPLLAYSKERWAEFRAEIPYQLPHLRQDHLNRKVQNEWEQMTDEEKAVYVKKVSASAHLTWIFRMSKK